MIKIKVVVLIAIIVVSFISSSVFNNCVATITFIGVINALFNGLLDLGTVRKVVGVEAVFCKDSMQLYKTANTVGLGGLIVTLKNRESILFSNF